MPLTILLSIALAVQAFAPRTGVIAWADESLGSHYLAVPWHRWHRPVMVRICAVKCITLQSTDAGPNRRMQAEGRIADLAVGLWEEITGKDRSAGLARGSIERVTVRLPATDTAP